MLASQSSLLELHTESEEASQETKAAQINATHQFPKARASESPREAVSNGGSQRLYLWNSLGDSKVHPSATDTKLDALKSQLHFSLCY